MGEGKVEKQQKKLIELGVMESGDKLIDFLQASYVERLMGNVSFGKWKQGWAYFTEERLIVLTGVLNENIIIPYNNIRELGKCSQTLIPIGMKITYEDTKTGKIVTDKISMMKRNHWLDFIAEKAGITIS